MNCLAQGQAGHQLPRSPPPGQAGPSPSLRFPDPSQSQRHNQSLSFLCCPGASRSSSLCAFHLLFLDTLPALWQHLGPRRQRLRKHTSRIVHRPLHGPLEVVWLVPQFLPSRESKMPSLFLTPAHFCTPPMWYSSKIPDSFCRFSLSEGKCNKSVRNDKQAKCLCPLQP